MSERLAAVTEVEPQFIVQLPNGRKSKPTTRAAIQQMYAAGKIPLPADVVCSGRAFCVPVDEFVSDSGLLQQMLRELPDSQKPDGLNSLIEPATVFVPRSAGPVDAERLPELPAITFPAGSAQSSGNLGQSNKTVGGPKLMLKYMKIAFGITIAVMAGIILSIMIAWNVISYIGAKNLERIHQEEAREKKIQDAKDAIENAKAKKIQDARDRLFEEYDNLCDEMYEYEEIDKRGSWLAPGSPGGPGTKKRARFDELQKTL